MQENIPVTEEMIKAVLEGSGEQITAKHIKELSRAIQEAVERTGMSEQQVLFEMVEAMSAIELPE